MLQDQLTILRWAAGAQVPPQVESFEPHQVPELLKRYRLSGRFLRRLEREPVTWVSDEIREVISSDQEFVEQKIRRQLLVLREVQAARRDRDSPLLVLKGLSRYATAGAIMPRRRSGDIDLIAADLDDLTMAFIHLGFRSMKVPTFHEYGNLARDDIVIDIHRYFPIWTWEPDLERSAFTPRDHPGVWRMEHDVERGQINLADLIANADYGTEPGTEDVLVPSPAMMVLLSCAHVLDDYAQSALSATNGAVRLVELAEIRDLTAAPGFDAQLFSRLCGRLRGLRARTLANQLIRTFLGPGPFTGEGSESTFFPQRLWYDFWINVERPMSDLLVPEVRIADLIDQLGANRVAADSGQACRWYSALDDTDEPLQRVLVRAPYGRELPLRLAVSWTPLGLTFRVRVLSPLGVRIERCRIDFGDEFCELVYEVPEDRFRLKGTRAKCELAVEPNSYTVTMELEWSALPRLDAMQTNLPVWLGVVRQGSEPQRALAGTLVPMLLTRT